MNHPFFGILEAIARYRHRATKHKKACDLVIPYREGGGVEGWGSGSYVHSRFWTISYVHSVLGEHKEKHKGIGLEEQL